MLGYGTFLAYTLGMKQVAATKRIYLVNRDFQIRYALAGVGAGLISTTLTAFLILYPLFTFKILVVSQFLPLPILLGMVSAAFFNALMLMLFGIVMTHRIAGPMYSMVRHMRRLASGQWRTTMKSRPDDDLQLLVRNLNDISDGLVKLAEDDLKILEQLIAADLSKPANEHASVLRSRIAARILEDSPGSTQK